MLSTAADDTLQDLHFPPKDIENGEKKVSFFSTKNSLTWGVKCEKLNFRES